VTWMDEWISGLVYPAAELPRWGRFKLISSSWLGVYLGGTESAPMPLLYPH